MLNKLKHKVKGDIDKYAEDNRKDSFSSSDEDVKKVKPSLHISSSQVSTPSVEDVIENINPAYRYIEEVEEHKKWDAFNQTEDTGGSASEKHTDLIKKASYCMKILTAFMTFIVVLVAACISKGALFFMIAQIRIPSNTSFYNMTSNTSDSIPFYKMTNPPLEYCPDNIFDRADTEDTKYYVDFGERQSISWMWCIFFAFIMPEIGAFLRSLKIVLVKTVHSPMPFDFFLVFIMETLHVTGVAILFYCALPYMDSVRAVMSASAVTLIPAIFKLCSDIQTTKDGSFGTKTFVFMALDVISIILLVVGLIVWPVVNSSFSDTPDDLIKTWAFPVGAILTSFGWWESFVSENSKIPPIRYLWRIKTNMIEGLSRYVTYLFISAWKILFFFILFIVFSTTVNDISDTSKLFDIFSMHGDGYSVIGVNGTDDGKRYQIANNNENLPWKILVTQIACGYAAYIFGKFACKVNIQKFAFAIPLTLVMPASIATVLGLCEVRSGDPCKFSNDRLPNHLFFQCPMDYTDPEGYDSLPLYVFSDLHGWVWILLFLAQCWIAGHIWLPKSRKLAKTEQMFGTPWYNGLLTDQSMMLNRRSDKGQLDFRLDFQMSKSGNSGVGSQYDARAAQQVDNSFHKMRRKVATTTIKYVEGSKSLTDEDTITRVMGCATMWHESYDEICEMLKSIFRIDEDYSARKLAIKILEVQDPDFYEWETHIFFDDCMEPDDTGYDFQVNQFVRLLIDTMDEQGKKWYGARNMKVPDPAKYATPYGGRLVWSLPGSTQVVCHLKDKNKIRHKKRWSQCMYFYYFLGYQLEAREDLTRAQKDARAMNTYCLALDGDVDFQPEAIIRLVDLMKRNPSVGAACGRIHPIGSGFMQWYQMFEYAIGHWLQKATEHVLGCVLCSPGCFSLFRGKAVMSDNVMQKYTTIATEPKHFVQYDQGEDRWLCTLLLQQGWRVEYSAASDSFTACPEGFNEFYNQRRRWMPSTIANIMDLLGDAKNVVQKNDDISYLYVLYQIAMMVGTLLGPGSIFLMLVGAFELAFKMEAWTAFALNMVPCVAFCILCLFGKTKHQLLMAQILSIAYAFVMVAVYIGMFISFSEDSIFAPTTLSFILVAGTFILAGFLHPQEFKCLPMGLIYMVMIPSMYLFLVIYSIFNLHVVSWGTREVAVKKSAAELEEEAKEAEEEAKQAELKQRKQTGTIWGRITGGTSKLGFFARTEEGLRGDLDKINSKLDGIERALKKEGYKVQEAPKKEETGAPKIKFSAPSTGQKETRPHIKRDEMVNPFWMEQSNQVKNGPIHKLSKEETTFWWDMIDIYLKPLEKNVKKEKQQAAGLIDLRNQMAFSMLMINGLWIVALFLMQLQKDSLSIPWPLPGDQPDLALEPLGLVFLVFFAVVLVLQLIGMLMHRIMTLGHIVATTTIPWRKALGIHKKKKFNADALLAKRGIAMMKEWQNGYQPAEDGSHTTMESAVEDILNKLTTGTEEEQRKYSQGLTLGNNKASKGLNRKQTISALRKRNQTYKERKATTKGRKPGGGRAYPPIAEDDESNPHYSVSRTLTQTDPDGKTERDV